MNGVHDMGGMQDMGPAQEEKNEPVFHHAWEGRVFAMYRAAGAWHKWNIDAARYSRELIPPAEYLRMSYYEKWYVGLVDLLTARGLVTRAEIESGRPALGSSKATPPLTGESNSRFRSSGRVHKTERFGGSALPGRPKRSRPQHQSRGTHAIAALCTREAGHDRSRLWRLCVSGHQRPIPGRKSPACLRRAFFRARAVGRTSQAARYRLYFHVG